MNYRILNINAGGPGAEANILIIYTGGTIGMITDDTGSLVSFNFRNILDKIPVLKSLKLRLTVISFPEPIDSSDINLYHWVDLGYIIHENYNQYDGFVVLHGTDTMAFTASALSFILEGLNKPVIFTGAQLPIGATRSDARENLITALEMAGTRLKGKPVVPEVCIYFNNHLLRGNRAKKAESIHFDAFESENYPPLAEAGVVIDYNFTAINPYSDEARLKFNHKLDSNVAILKLFPGIS
ncbi:MAG: asparaginase domain-containing protein, partial [Cyclobacteriaceae bacterium]